MRDNISGVPSGGVSGKGTQPGKTKIALCVQTLELKNLNSTVGPDATPAVRPMWDAHSDG